MMLDMADFMAGRYGALIDAPPNRFEQDLLDAYPRLRDVRNLIADTDAAIGIMQAPIYNLVGTLQGIINNFVWTLQAIHDQKAGAGGAPSGPAAPGKE